MQPRDLFIVRLVKKLKLDDEPSADGKLSKSATKCNTKDSWEDWTSDQVLRKDGFTSLHGTFNVKLHLLF